MQAASPSAACFGKLPTHGDFVRHHASGRAMQGFDGWVQQGLVRVRQHAGRAEPGGDGGAVCFFVDMPGVPHALAGVLRSSRDRVGRRYPFLVAVEAESRRIEGRRIPSWPVRYARFYAAATAFVNEAVAGHFPEADVSERLAALRALYDGALFPVDYEHRLRQTPAETLWARTWGDAEDGRKYVVLKNLTDGLANARGRAPRDAFRVPLPRDASNLDVSFWLEAYWRLLGRTPDQPALFWTTPDDAALADGAEHALFIASAPPPADLLVHLHDAAVPADGTVRALDDAHGEPAALAALALPARYGTLLEDDGLDLCAFLERL